MSKILVIFFVLFCSWTYSATINEKLYILSDSIEAFNGSKFPYKTFNLTNSFDQSNPFIELNLNDSLILWVVNKDNVVHDFEIKGKTGVQTIAVNDSIQLLLKMDQAGSYIYRDPSMNLEQSYLGLSGTILIKDHNFASFKWNIREHDSTWNVILNNAGSVNWGEYDPEYFTINGVSNPMINSNNDARIVGNVGDTLYLYISNCGRSVHSIHLHGYHAEIMQSSQFPNHVGREKDTFPISPDETLIIRIIPDKAGEYPVHDHNLVAVSGNNIYPNGMFITMLISP